MGIREDTGVCAFPVLVPTAVIYLGIVVMTIERFLKNMLEGALTWECQELVLI